MILYVETNFVLELTFAQSEHDACEALLALSATKDIEIAIPSFALVEPYHKLLGNRTRRRALYDTLASEMREVSRSEEHAAAADGLLKVASLIISSGDDDLARLDRLLQSLPQTTRLIPLTERIIVDSLPIRAQYSLPPFDALIFSTILADLVAQGAVPSCMVTKDKGDFLNPDIEDRLSELGCKLLHTFHDAHGFLARPRKASA